MIGQGVEKAGGTIGGIHRLLEFMDDLTRKFDPSVCLAGMAGEHRGFRATRARELEIWAK